MDWTVLTTSHLGYGNAALTYLPPRRRISVRHPDWRILPTNQLQLRGVQAEPTAAVLKQQVIHPIATIASEQAPETVAAVGLEARKTAAIIGQSAEPAADKFVHEQLL